MSEASDITRQAGSNLAVALRLLPPQKRADMVVFYAFCRVIDDLADDETVPAEARKAALERWRQGLRSGFAHPAPLEREVIEMRDRREIPNVLLEAVIDGCLMDLEPRRFETWEELSRYTWKVASAVGLVSVRLFGASSSATDEYAVALGHALQLTNILRDVGEDWWNGGRIYLPLEDLRHFGYSERDLEKGVRDARFMALMTFEAERAEAFYREAEAHLRQAGKERLAPARMMAEVYRTLLKRMRADGFRVFDRRYRLSKARKFLILLKHLIASKLPLE